MRRWTFFSSLSAVILLLLLVAFLVWRFHPASGSSALELPGHQVTIQIPVSMHPVTPLGGVLLKEATSDNRERVDVGVVPGVHFKDLGTSDEIIMEKLGRDIAPPFGPPSTFIHQKNHLIVQCLNTRNGKTYLCDVWEDNQGLVMLKAILESPAEADSFKIAFQTGKP